MATIDLIVLGLLKKAPMGAYDFKMGEDQHAIHL